MSDHGDFQELWSPGQELSTDVSYVGSSDFCKNSPCSGLDVWDSIISHQDVGSWWHSESMISESTVFQWCFISCFIWNFYIYTWLRVWGLRWYIYVSGCGIMVTFRINDLRINSFPMMFHILVYLKLFKSLHA